MLSDVVCRIPFWSKFRGVRDCALLAVLWTADLFCFGCHGGHDGSGEGYVWFLSNKAVTLYEKLEIPYFSRVPYLLPIGR
jgi:hypothetical protein